MFVPLKFVGSTMHDVEVGVLVILLGSIEVGFGLPVAVRVE